MMIIYNSEDKVNTEFVLLTSLLHRCYRLRENAPGHEALGRLLKNISGSSRDQATRKNLTRKIAEMT